MFALTAVRGLRVLVCGCPRVACFDVNRTCYLTSCVTASRCQPIFTRKWKITGLLLCCEFYSTKCMKCEILKT